MSEADQRGVDRIFANMGKAIEAFERAIAPTADALRPLRRRAGGTDSRRRRPMRFSARRRLA